MVSRDFFYAFFRVFKWEVLIIAGLLVHFSITLMFFSAYEFAILFLLMALALLRRIFFYSPSKKIEASGLSTSSVSEISPSHPGRVMYAVQEPEDIFKDFFKEFKWELIIVIILLAYVSVGFLVDKELSIDMKLVYGLGLLSITLLLFMRTFLLPKKKK